MIRKIPLSDHYYKEREIDDFLDEKSDKTHGHGDINKDGKITANASSVNKIAVTDSSNSIKTVDVLPLNKITHQDISGKVNKTDIQDNFSSTAVDKPLSANKGTELKNLVDTKANSDNVYSKAETMSTSDIRQAIADGVGNIDIFEPVSELPTSNIKGNKFYLTPNNENIDKNIYDINIYVNNNWETIDSLEFDISNYPTTSEVTILLNGKVDVVEGKGLSSNDFTDALKNKLENNVLTQHQSLANYIQKSQTQGLIKNDGTIDTNNYLTKETAPKIYNYGFIDSNLVLHLVYIDTEVSITRTIIQTGDSNQITILVTDEEGNPLENIPVDLYANGVKVGQTVDTNANGLSIHTYTGSGSGEVELQAKIGSVVSETLSVFDYFLYDNGVTGTKNPNVTVGTNVTEQVTSNGTVLTCTNGTSLATAQYTYTNVIGGDFEAYVTLTTPSSILVGFYGGSDSARISISNVENRTYKFKRTGSNWIVQYYDGSEWVDLSFYNNTLGNKDCRFYLYLYSDNETDTVTFKDVKVSVESVLNIGGDSIVQTGDTINITGKFYESGVPVKNIDLDVYKNGVKVDTVNTGSTGVASYTYTGTGVGEVDFQFKYGYFVSETVKVIDCTVYDKGLSGEGQHNDIYYLSSGITGCLSRTSDGTLIDISNAGITSNQQCYVNQTGAYTFNIPRESIVEFDVVSVDNSDIRLQVSNIGTTTKYSSALLNEGSAPFHVKIMVEATETKIYFDDTLKATTTGCDGEKVSIMFLFYQNKGTSIKFKDMCIYPI